MIGLKHNIHREASKMGSGRSGIYYTTHGSHMIHHIALIHSLEGEYTMPSRPGQLPRLKSGGHGQDAIDFMDKNGIKYNIVKTYKNGVRVGNVPSHKKGSKAKGTNQSWFPKSWGQKEVVKAAEHVCGLKQNAHAKDGQKLYGKYKGILVVGLINIGEDKNERTYR